MKLSVSLTVNGKPVSAEVESRTLLVDFLRDRLRLTGTHIGCDTAQCGACTVLVDGKPVKACNVLAIQLRGREVTTIEGLAANGTLHPMQAAFKQHHGLQCGFCTPGMVMTAVGLAQQEGEPTEARIREALDGNFCRCTGYHNIVKSVQAGLEAMKATSETAA
jgi:carbon-monoxide dehydrogenase small subunit